MAAQAAAEKDEAIVQCVRALFLTWCSPASERAVFATRRLKKQFNEVGEKRKVAFFQLKTRCEQALSQVLKLTA